MLSVKPCIIYIFKKNKHYFNALRETVKKYKNKE
jgi:hypothetical protein